MLQILPSFFLRGRLEFMAALRASRSCFAVIGLRRALLCGMCSVEIVSVVAWWRAGMEHLGGPPWSAVGLLGKRKHPFAALVRWGVQTEVGPNQGS